jgi:cytoskeletal protein CcmA (bactofilin family)
MAGNVLASDRIELTPTADVTGTITAPAVVLQDGATFNGIIDMERKPKTDKAPVKTGPTPVEQVAKAS